jgi:hypothetical protein
MNAYLNRNSEESNASRDEIMSLIAGAVRELRRA